MRDAVVVEAVVGEAREVAAGRNTRGGRRCCCCGGGGRLGMVAAVPVERKRGIGMVVVGVVVVGWGEGIVERRAWRRARA